MSAPDGPGRLRALGWPKTLLAAALIGIAVAAVYSGTLRDPFVFDDITAIPENPSIRALWPLWGTLAAPATATTMAGRPVANLTLALNYARGGTDPSGYHALNILVHALGCLALYGVIRRTLLLPPLEKRFGGDAFPLALLAALIWGLHPLQTESVTYVVQRVESMAGLFYLVCLYCFLRSTQAARPLGWRIATVLSCLVGMGTKEVMATAPFALFFFDRTFLAGSFSGAWRQRRGLYLCLAATWVPRRSWWRARALAGGDPRGLARLLPGPTGSPSLRRSRATFASRSGPTRRSLTTVRGSCTGPARRPSPRSWSWPWPERPLRPSGRALRSVS